MATLHSIQTCRIAAATLVVVFHAGYQLAKPGFFGESAQYLERAFWFGGQAGVVFFFVLSGFIIAHTHFDDFDRPDKLRGYFRKRVLRIYPPYLFFFCAVYSLAMLFPAAAEKMPTDPMVILKSLALIPQDKDAVGGTGAPVLVVAWSLQYEVVFYAAFAVGFVRRWLLSALCMIYLMIFMFQMMMGRFPFPLSFFASHVILLFGFGVVAELLLRRSRKFANCLALVRGSMAAMAAVAVFASLTRGSEPNWLVDMAYAGISAILIVSLAAHETTTLGSAPRSQKIFSLLGASSYAIYLVHVPMIWLLGKLATLLLPPNHLSAGFSFAVIVSMCILAGVAFHLLLEAPFLRLLRRDDGPARPYEAV